MKSNLLCVHGTHNFSSPTGKNNVGTRQNMPAEGRRSFFEFTAVESNVNGRVGLPAPRPEIEGDVAEALLHS